MIIPSLHRSRFIIALLLIVLFVTVPGIREASAQDFPPEAQVSGVYGHPQGHNLSCESRSASDWAAYFGVSISEDAILSALPRSDNPEAGFVGSPDGPVGNIPPYSYGVHPPALAKVLRGFGLNAQERQGMAWDEVRGEIAAGRPVIVWIIGQMWPGQPIAYTAEDGQSTTVAHYEHTMIVTGYTPQWVYVVDALNGQDQIYDLNGYFNSWAVLGQRAIVLEGEPPAQPTQAPIGSETYVVERGETLTGLAERFSVPWRDLASANQLAYPYMLLAGQTLRLPLGSQLTQATPVPTQAPTQAPTPTRPTIAPGNYRVVPGDTLFGIARRYQLTWQELVKLNQLAYPYFIYAGQDLRLPESAQLVEPTPVPPEPTPQPSATPQVYIVQPGDTLAKIGAKLGLDWRLIASINGLGSPFPIYAGQALKLP